MSSLSLFDDDIIATVFLTSKTNLTAINLTATNLTTTNLTATKAERKHNLTDYQRGAKYPLMVRNRVSSLL